MLRGYYGSTLTVERHCNAARMMLDVSLWLPAVTVAYACNGMQLRNHSCSERLR